MQIIKVQGQAVPALGYGTWKLRGEECVTGVRAALDIGYRHIDTAQIYENEGEVGKAIEAGGVARSEIFLTTKVWIDHVRDGDLQKSVTDSLARLRTDYVDLLLIHWPVETVSFREQMKALREMQDKGLARLIGVSNFTVAQMKDVTGDLGVAIACNQVEYHPYLDQKPVLDFVRGRDMFMTAYSPVARGLVMEDETMRDIADKYNKTPAQISLRWLIQQDRVAAIPKAANPKHAQANFDIFDFALTDADMAAIHKLARPDGRMINPDWAPKWDTAKAA
jgi:diketogulonate reductase-like aldo/keto reductase